MATEITNRTYEEIDRPYDTFLQRSDQTVSMDTINQPGTGTGDSNITPSGAGTNGSVETQPVKTDGAVGDVWIKNFIRSFNWKPKSVGFYIDGNTGYAEFSNVHISGNVIALTGTIGGFVITATTISSTGITLTSGASASLAFGSTPPTAPALGTGIFIDQTGLFGLDNNTQNFKISAIDGSITAIKGFIGGTVITASSISSSNFVSGLLGKGWRISSTGEGEFENITARGVFRTSVFEKGTISSVGGYLLVSPSDVLNADMTALDASTLTTRSVVFPNNSVLRIKDGTDDEYMLVTSSAGFVHTVTRDLAAAYGANSNPIWKTGTAVVSLGVGTGTKTGFIVMDTASSNSPFIDILSRNSNTYGDYTTKVRIGNLEGITDATVGLPLGTQNYGIYTNNGYFSGTVVAVTGTIGGFNLGADYIRDAANSFGMASTVTGGDDIRFWAGATFANRTTAPFRVYESGVVLSISAPIQTYTPSAAGTATLDLSTGNDHRITMPAGNVTIALSNVTVGQKFTVSITQDSVGSRTVTWFTTIRWVGGNEPGLSSAANKRDTFGLICTGSNTYDGFIIGLFL